MSDVAAPGLHPRSTSLPPPLVEAFMLSVRSAFCQGWRAHRFGRLLFAIKWLAGHLVRADPSRHTFQAKRPITTPLADIVRAH